MRVIEIDERILVVCFCHEKFAAEVIANKMLVFLREAIKGVMLKVGEALIAFGEQKSGEFIYGTVIIT